MPWMSKCGSATVVSNTLRFGVVALGRNGRCFTGMAAVQVMASELSARLKKAIDGSNVKHFEDDVQERLALRKAAGGGAAVTIADVMQVCTYYPCSHLVLCQPSGGV